MRREPPVDLRPYFLTFSDLPSGQQINWREFFGNDNSVELDIGCHRGVFLLSAALTRPDVNFLGIEIDFAEGRRAARKLWKRELPNARVLGGDARWALARLVPQASIAAVHVYFPDPWWKKKHRSRRLFNDEFVLLAARVLRPGGLLHSWTDVDDYFEVIAALMDHSPLFEPQAPPPEQAPSTDLDYHTGFERKKRKEGGIVYRGLWRRNDVVQQELPAMAACATWGDSRTAS